MMNNDLKFITEDIKKRLKKINFDKDIVSAGRVISSTDGVIFIEGLTAVKNGELLFIPDYNYAIAMNLEENGVGAILLTGGTREISNGDIAYTTGEIVSIGVGDELLGRVVNPLGRPLDGLEPIRAAKQRNIETKAPGIFDRAKVAQPLLTGITAIDAMIPIGKGQRELILGDRQTGKTALAIDTIINQKDKDVICVYVAIGQKASTVSRIIKALKEHDAMNNTVIVCSTADQTAPLQYISPYTGTAIAEQFVAEGKDVLIVYDDLSKHAVAYRTISLLLRRPSGREAFPGDVFFIHSRLLERSAKLSEKLGGGSLTALPIVETLSGDISGYIPTNVISITDGQIFLETELFHSGIRPAINVGLSVSRVGGSAQYKAMRKVSSTVRLDLAHYREMLVFSQFGADLDEGTLAIIGKGERLTEALKQPQYFPLPMAETVVELSLMTRDLLSDIPTKKVRNFLDGFKDFLRERKAGIFERISDTKELTDDDEALIFELLTEYKKGAGYEGA